MNDLELLAELKKIDTPTITNVVATYPGRPLCLEISWKKSYAMPRRCWPKKTSESGNCSGRVASTRSKPSWPGIST